MKVAVILSGCGFLDGSEIYETVSAFMAIEQAGASYECFAPSIEQTQVLNFITRDSMPEKRNVLVEAARLARGKIKDIKEAHAKDFDALIVPGGFGAASNLCNFAEKGADCHVEPEVKRFIDDMRTAKKPVGFICIAPAIAARIYGEKLKCTIGNDKQTAKALNDMGAEHVECAVSDIVIDKTHKVVTTPAFMLGKSITEIYTGIEKLVRAVLTMAE